MANNLNLSDAEKFIFYAFRSFNGLFSKNDYESNLQHKGVYIVLVYESSSLKQSFEFTYDFLRSERIYYQLLLKLKKGKKEFIIDPLKVMTKEKEPTNIADCVYLYKECLVRNLIEVIEGKARIDDVKKILI